MNKIRPTRILYAINGTGKGHVSRATVLLPYLKQTAHVDILISGQRQPILLDYPITFTKKGLTFSYNKGAVDWLETIKKASVVGLIKDILSLDLSPYDLVLSDFEPIGAWAALIQKKNCISISHQTSFYSRHCPRPKNWWLHLIDELFLRYFAYAKKRIGFHYKPYSSFIFPSLIKKELITLTPNNHGPICVYLSSYSLQQQQHIFSQCTTHSFAIFHKDCTASVTQGNLTISPLSEHFKHHLLHAEGLITNSGFEGTSEALYLQKPLLSLPIRHQYEQYCNAAALKKEGATIAHNLTVDLVNHWLVHKKPPRPVTPCCLTTLLDTIDRLALDKD